MRRKGKPNWVFTIVVAAILTTTITFFINSAWNDYADVYYQMSGSKWVWSHESAKIDLNLQNKGKIGIVPTCTVFIVNATIQSVLISGVPEYQLSNFCSFNDTVAKFTNLTLSAGWGLGGWASIYVVPDKGVSSFSASAQVTLPFDLLHPNNKVGRIIPYELMYNATDSGVFELLD